MKWKNHQDVKYYTDTPYVYVYVLQCSAAVFVQWYSYVILYTRILGICPKCSLYTHAQTDIHSIVEWSVGIYSYTVFGRRPFDGDNDDACPWLWHGNYQNIVLTLMDSASLVSFYFFFPLVYFFIFFLLLIRALYVRHTRVCVFSGTIFPRPHSPACARQDWSQRISPVSKTVVRPTIFPRRLFKYNVRLPTPAPALREKITKLKKI